MVRLLLQRDRVDGGTARTCSRSSTSAASATTTRSLHLFEREILRDRHTEHVALEFDDGLYSIAVASTDLVQGNYYLSIRCGATRAALRGGLRDPWEARHARRLRARRGLPKEWIYHFEPTATTTSGRRSGGHGAHGQRRGEEHGGQDHEALRRPLLHAHHVQPAVAARAAVSDHHALLALRHGRLLQHEGAQPVLARAVRRGALRGLRPDDGGDRRRRPALRQRAVHLRDQRADDARDRAAHAEHTEYGSCRAGEYVDYYVTTLSHDADANLRFDLELQDGSKDAGAHAAGVPEHGPDRPGDAAVFGQRRRRHLQRDDQRERPQLSALVGHRLADAACQGVGHTAAATSASLSSPRARCWRRPPPPRRRRCRPARTSSTTCRSCTEDAEVRARPALATPCPEQARRSRRPAPPAPHPSPPAPPPPPPPPLDPRRSLSSHARPVLDGAAPSELQAARRGAVAPRERRRARARCALAPSSTTTGSTPTPPSRSTSTSRSRRTSATAPCCATAPRLTRCRSRRSHPTPRRQHLQHRHPGGNERQHADLAAFRWSTAHLRRRVLPAW